MTRDENIRMAREAGFALDHGEDADLVDRFAALVRADERKQCAKVCDDLQRSYWNSTRVMDEPDAYDCAAAIRARSNQ